MVRTIFLDGLYVFEILISLCPLYFTYKSMLVSIFKFHPIFSGDSLHTPYSTQVSSLLFLVSVQALLNCLKLAEWHLVDYCSQF